MLKPLQEITAAARKAASGSLDHRIGLTGIRDEFTDLSDTFDEMLGRLQRSFEQYRRFAANASHELRTPHAVMKTMLEVAAADPDHQDVPELVKRLAETNQRGIDIVEALLSLTALNNRAVEVDPVDLAAVVRSALPALSVGGARRGGRAHLRSRGVGCRGQRGVAAPGGDEPGAERDPARRRLRRDHGRARAARRTEQRIGAPPARIRTFTEPFAKARYGAGHGLGLALVDRIVETHHGSLDLAPIPGGGLTVTVVLPTADLVG